MQRPPLTALSCSSRRNGCIARTASFSTSLSHGADSRPTAASTANVPTPSTITRLYRLVLRYAAASVLYSKPASQNLKRLYRPEFDIWMGRVQRAGNAERLVQDRAEWEEFARRSGLPPSLSLNRCSGERPQLTPRARAQSKTRSISSTAPPPRKTSRTSSRATSPTCSTTWIPWPASQLAHLAAEHPQSL